MTFEEFLTSWLEQTRAKVQPNTYVPYERHVRLHLIPRLGSVPVAELRPAHVRELYAELERDNVSATQRRKIGTTLGTALRQAGRQRLIRFNPASEIPKPRAIRPETQVFTPEQVRCFLEAARGDSLYALYVVALDSGMKQGELFALQWSDIDFQTGTILVQRSLEEIKGKLRVKEVSTKRGRRRVELAGGTLDVLHEHRKLMLARGRAAGPVFCDTEGGYLRKSHVSQRSFRPILRRANEQAAAGGLAPVLPDIRFHDLRHTSAALLFRAHVSLARISERLGHSSIQITLDTYSHLLPSLRRASVTVPARAL